MAFIPKTNEINIEEELPVKQSKTFKEYYADPEFKRRHLEKMRTKVECPVCSVMISRSNMVKHSRTAKHQKTAEKIELLTMKSNLLDSLFKKILFDEKVI